MLIKDLNFRSLDKKWFLIENPRELNKINIIIRTKKSNYPVIGYSFIDHDEGISMLLLGNIKVVNNNVTLDKKVIDSKNNIIRYKKMENLQVRELTSDILDKIDHIKEVEEDIDNKYYNNDVIVTRLDDRLDEDRDINLVDDVKFLIIDKEHGSEFAWVRLEKYLSSEDSYIGIVTEEPSFTIKNNDVVILKYVEREKFTGLAFLKKYEKDEE